MREAAALMLAEGDVTKFFENPAVLLGIPLVVLGVIGILLILSPLGFAGPRAPAEAVAAPPPTEEHFTPATYIRVGLILAVVTILEVGIYYVDMVHGALVGILVVLSFMKFALVVLWFMHLRYDNPLFSTLFTGGLLLVAALFVVVLTSLGASLV
jgi:cytochrome c oxidase subunit 4